MPTEPDDATIARVRRELADLAEAPAPAPPPDVTAAVVAALRGHHRVVPADGGPLRHADRPPVRRGTWLFVGLLAAGVAVIVAVVVAAGCPATDPALLTSSVLPRPSHAGREHRGLR